MNGERQAGAACVIEDQAVFYTPSLTVLREMKRAQIGLLLRLKGRLTPEQQATLRQRMPQGPPGPREER